MRTAALPLVLIVLLAAPAVAQDGPPPEVYLPDGVVRPDLTGYQIVVVRPEDSDAFLDAVTDKTLKRDVPVAWLFAPGDHVHDATAWKNLWRQRRGTASQPQYIGPLDPTAPLPVLDSSAYLAGSGHLVIQGLVLKGLKISGIPGEPRGLPVTVEGCWIDGGVLIQGGKNDDGTDRPAGDALVRRCWIMDSEGQGIYSNNSIDCRIEECVIDYAGSSKTRDHAVYLAHTKNFTVERCILTRPSSSAFKDNTSEGATLRDCLIAGAHNWASVNANPKPTTVGDQGRDFLAEGNVITSMHRRNGDPAGTSYFGWSYKGITIRGNLFVQNDWSKGTAAIALQEAIYNGQYAGPCEDVQVRDNVVYGYRGHLVRIKGHPDLRRVTIAGNVVAEPPEWDGTVAHTNPFSANDLALPYLDEFGLVFGENIWPRWAPISPFASIMGGQGAEVVFKDPSRTLATLAGEMGEAATEDGFYRLLRKNAPNVMIEKALHYFRQGYKVKNVLPADPPDSLPWIDESEGDNPSAGGNDPSQQVDPDGNITIVEFTVFGKKKKFTVDPGSLLITKQPAPTTK